MKTLPRIVKQWVETPSQMLRLVEVEVNPQHSNSKFRLEQRYKDLMGGDNWRSIDKSYHQDKIINALVDN